MTIEEQTNTIEFLKDQIRGLQAMNTTITKQKIMEHPEFTKFGYTLSLQGFEAGWYGIVGTGNLRSRLNWQYSAVGDSEEEVLMDLYTQMVEANTNLEIEGDNNVK
jgi:hypothetical protein